jgi:myosin heavy subunit
LKEKQRRKMTADSAVTVTTSIASRGAAEISTSNHVYILSEEHSWVPARVISTSDEEESGGKSKKKAIVSIPKYKTEQEICSDGGLHAKGFDRIQIDLFDEKHSYAGGLLPLQNVDEHGHLKQVEDMVDLPFLHEAAILYNLKARHVRGKPYTRTGDIIIAVNPYQVRFLLYSTVPHLFLYAPSHHSYIYIYTHTHTHNMMTQFSGWTNCILQQ